MSIVVILFDLVFNEIICILWLYFMDFTCVPQRMIILKLNVNLKIVTFKINNCTNTMDNYYYYYFL